MQPPKHEGRAGATAFAAGAPGGTNGATAFATGAPGGTNGANAFAAASQSPEVGLVVGELDNVCALRSWSRPDRATAFAAAPGRNEATAFCCNMSSERRVNPLA